MRILLIRRGALGDVIVTIPLLLNLRRIYPESFIEVVGDRIYWSITLPWLVNKITDKEAAPVNDLYSSHSLSNDSEEYYRGFNLIIGFVSNTDDIKHKLIQCGIHNVVLKEPFSDSGHIIDYTNTALEEIDTEVDKIKYPKIEFETDEITNAMSRLTVSDGSEKHIAIHPRTYGIKGLPIGIYIELANYIKNKSKAGVVWVIGPAEKEYLGQLEDIFGRISVLRLTNLKILAAVISQMDLYFGCDTGISHMSAATNVNSIILFGPTDPYVWGPRGENVQILKTSLLEDIDTACLKDIILNSIDKKIGITQVKKI